MTRLTWSNPRSGHHSQVHATQRPGPPLDRDTRGHRAALVARPWPCQLPKGITSWTTVAVRSRTPLIGWLKRISPRGCNPLTSILSASADRGSRAQVHAVSAERRDETDFIALPVETGDAEVGPSSSRSTLVRSSGSCSRMSPAKTYARSNQVAEGPQRKSPDSSMAAQQNSLP